MQTNHDDANIFLQEDLQEHVRQVFNLLKPTCILISSCIQSNEFDALSKALETLNKTLVSLSPSLSSSSRLESENDNKINKNRLALKQCFQYITFPLLILCEKDYMLFRQQQQQQIHHSSTIKATNTRVPLRCMEQVFSCFNILFQTVEQLPSTTTTSTSSNDQIMKFIALYQTMFIVHTSENNNSIINNGSSNDVNLDKKGTNASANSSRNSNNNNSNDDIRVIYSTEEIKLNLVKSFGTLVKYHILEMKNQIFANHRLQPLVALFISKLIDLVIEERATHLREECLNTLSYLLESIHDLVILRSVFPGIVSSLFKLLYTLPGVNMSQDGITPSRKAANRTKLGQRLLCEAFKTFRILIGLVCTDMANHEALQMEKKSLEVDLSDVSNAFSNLSLRSDHSLNSTKKEEISPPRGEVAELTLMRERLDSFLQHIFSPENYAFLKSPLVRLELIKTCQLVVEQCSQILWISIPRTIECVMIASYDESAPNNSYRELASNVLVQFQKRFHLSDERLSNLLFERFTALVHSIPNTCTTSTDEDEKLAKLVLLNAYFRVLMTDKRLLSLMTSASLVPKIAFALMVALEFENTNEKTKLVEQKIQSIDIAMHMGSTYFDYPKKYFKNIRDERLFHTCVQICQSIGNCASISALETFIDHFRQLILQSPFWDHHSSLQSTSKIRLQSYHKESILIIEHFLRGFATKIEQSSDPCLEEREVLSNTIRTLIRDYFEEYAWQFNGRSSKSLSVPLLHDSIVCRCLLLESVGTFFELLCATATDIEDWNKRERNSYLVRTLYPILEQFGTQYSSITDSAIQTLDRISQTEITLNDESHNCPKSQQLQRVTELISTNSDYIIDDIRQKMKFINLYPSTPFVLKVLFAYAALRETFTTSENTKDSYSMISVIQDTLDSTFAALDDFHLSKNYSNEYARVFFSIMNSVVHLIWERKKRYDDNIMINSDQSEESSSQNQHADSGGLFSSEDELDDEEEDDEPPPEYNGEEEDDESKLPEEVQRERTVVRQILSKCQNFITLDDMSIKIHIIDIVEKALLIFTSKEGKIESKALPLINSLWPLIFSRVITASEKPQVQQKALELVERLIQCSDEFMYSRIVQDLWPRLRVHPLLERNRKESDEHNKQGQAYIHTRMQHEQRIRAVQQQRLESVESDPYSYTRTEPMFKLHFALFHLLKVLSSDVHNVFMRRLSMGSAKNTLQAYDLCDMLYPFLDARIPLELQTIVSEIVSNIAKVDAASVWLLSNEWIAKQHTVNFKRKGLPKICFPAALPQKTQQRNHNLILLSEDVLLSLFGMMN